MESSGHSALVLSGKRPESCSASSGGAVHGMLKLCPRELCLHMQQFNSGPRTLYRILCATMCNGSNRTHRAADHACVHFGILVCQCLC